MQPWIEATFDPSRLCDEALVRDKIIEQRINELTRAGHDFRWNEFQIQCESLPARALLLAPCGSGKTLAAWRWIAARVRERPVAHVLFLYPTRATAKEGFRDYVSWAPEAALMHATSSFDLEGMFANSANSRDESHYEVDRRLYSLGFWARRAFSATVDQFLAFLQYGYGPVCMLPVLADSVVVVDEVHSFDRNMFSALKEFLKLFDLPVLCMTATLPNERQSELVNECGLVLYADRPGMLKETSEAPRYRLRRTTESEARDRIRAALNDGRRVLWVVNQVQRAQQAALALACDFEKRERQDRLHVLPGVPLLCYHSRFKLIDRVKRHDAVVQAFRKGQPAALAITTQVCEMSLNMDADLLVTEACPVTSLIQRMGRCNREQQPRPLPFSGEVLVYEPDDLAPYDAAALTGLQEFLTALDGLGPIHQAELEAVLGKVPSPPAVGDASCSFVSSGPYAMGGEEGFRDIEEFNIQAVTRSDVQAFLNAEKKAQPGWTIPVPRRLAREARPPKWPSYLGVARDGHYHQALGFCDEPLAEIGGTN
jgi:CRISPR-associated endonuclease/helicase Cas3